MNGIENYQPSRDKHLDKSIRNAIIKLHEEGLITAGSCAGHRTTWGPKSPTGGFVTFLGTLTPEETEEAKAILRQSGAKNLEFEVLTHPEVKNVYSVIRWSNPLEE